jgi:hypothetical protein
MLAREAGKNWQTNGDGGEMRRRFQVGHVFKRGKRVKVWVGCYREWALDGGRPGSYNGDEFSGCVLK